jgi:Kinesin motor domain
VDDDGYVCLARDGSAPKYAFDTVHQEASSNREVFQASGAPVVQAAVQGINGTMFAYGVTSSGKTHTMMGVPGQPGVVQQAVQHLFQEIGQTRSRVFLLKFSMLEIYNEVINDLLEPRSTNLRLRADPDRDTVYVEGAANIEVRSEACSHLSVVRKPPSLARQNTAAAPMYRQTHTARTTRARPEGTLVRRQQTAQQHSSLAHAAHTR